MTTRGTILLFCGRSVDRWLRRRRRSRRQLREGSSSLVALSPALETLWTLDLPGVFRNYATAVMADDGILYAQMSTSAGNEIIAVQTTSPGLASSSWPSRRHANRS